MGSSIYQFVAFALGGAIFGGLVGWAVRAIISRRHVGELAREAEKKLDEVTSQRNQFAERYSRSRSKIETLEAAYSRRSAEFEVVLEKAKGLAKRVRRLRNERERTKTKIDHVQNAFETLRQQTAALQGEFEKSRDFYKRELTKSFEKRKALEDDVRDARAEQESFARLVEESSLEHGSTENMVVAAQLRLGQIKVLERNVDKLEAENAELGDEIVLMKKQLASRDRDLAQLEELKLHNQQLLRGVEALEDSRKEHEVEADTLRLKLDDLEKNFADMEKQQTRAINEAREADVVPILRNRG